MEFIMVNLSLAHFKLLTARNDWHRHIEFKLILSTVKPIVCGKAIKTSSVYGIKITYTESFTYDEYDFDSLVTSTKGLDEVWDVDGVSVVDENNDELNATQLAEYLNSEFSSIGYDLLDKLDSRDELCN